MPRTSHTLELAQLADLNARLSKHRSPVTAVDLGLQDAPPPASRPAGGLPGSAVLVRLCWDGPPEFPYVHAHFTVTDESADRVVDLHTAALRALGLRLGAHQRWGD
jgi:hypothetical protein